MTLHLHAITDVDSLLKIRNKWNAFIIDNSDNPFLLCEFVKGFMSLAFSKGKLPVIFVEFINREIIGAAPFVLKRRFNIVSASFLFEHHLSPDIIVKDEYRRSFLGKVLSLSFDRFKCGLIDLVLPSSSKNASMIKLICEGNNLKCFSHSPTYLGHCVLPIKSSWSDFEKTMGSNFRRYFRKIERKMMESGGYEVTFADKFDDSVFENICYVERGSWKEKWRKQKRTSVDEELLRVLEGIKEIDSTISAFKWRIWFLKINGELASYALTMQFKDVGYIVKTSFNEKYRNHYPGIYIINAAVRDFFERAEVRKIDYQTSLPFMEKWEPLFYSRTRIMVGRRSLHSHIANISTNKAFCILRDQMLGPLIAKLPLEL